MNGLILSHHARSALIEATEQRPLHPEKTKARVIHFLLMPKRRSEDINHSNFKQMPLVFSRVQGEYSFYMTCNQINIYFVIFIQKTGIHPYSFLSYSLNAQMAERFKEA